MCACYEKTLDQWDLNDFKDELIDVETEIDARECSNNCIYEKYLGLSFNGLLAKKKDLEFRISLREKQ